MRLDSIQAGENGRYEDPYQPEQSIFSYLSQTSRKLLSRESFEIDDKLYTLDITRKGYSYIVNISRFALVIHNLKVEFSALQRFDTQPAFSHQH